jgi:hypothetical protein
MQDAGPGGLVSACKGVHIYSKLKFVLFIQIDCQAVPPSSHCHPFHAYPFLSSIVTYVPYNLQDSLVKD